MWPGPTYFPDWFAANATRWWTQELSRFHELAAFDGIWIDMNEVSNFCNDAGTSQICVLDPNNSCPDNSCCLICSTPEPDNQYDFPPFVPNTYMQTMSGKTVSMNAYHAGGVLEYNAHNMYGFMESIATRDALVSVTGQRPFLLSRSTFPGSGSYAAHWTGDNAARWPDLAASIITMVSDSLVWTVLISLLLSLCIVCILVCM